VTLGRGGSDTSAVAIAAALGPAPCHIITDVAAVFDRDPAVHPDARRIGQIDPLALVVLAEAGARVVHAEAARLALAHGVTLHVYAYWAPLSGRGGTVVRRAPALSEAA